jgi:hypothetical protein
MKKLIKEFHNQMIEGCYPIHPLPIYMFMGIALVYGLMQIL